MRKKSIAIILSAVLILTMLPVTVLAADEYNNHDVSEMTEFLNQNSAISGQTNAQVLGCSAADPSTWQMAGIFWNTGTSEKYINALWLSSKKIAGSLNLSGCAHLAMVYCQNNSLVSIDFSACPELKEIHVYNNPLTTLKMTDSTALTKLEAYSSKLSSVDVSGYQALTEIDCHDCAIDTLKLTGCSALTNISCSQNRLTSLNVSDSKLLENLDCSSNQLSGLDLRNNTALTSIECDTNKLTSLELPPNNSLSQLICEYNDFTSLNLSGSASLMVLVCDHNKLTTLDLSASSALKMLTCTDNPLTSVKANNSGHIISVKADGNGFVNLYMSIIPGGTSSVYASMAANSPAVFYNWTQVGGAASTDALYEMTSGSDYDLTAHFLSLSSSEPGNSTYAGGHITITPTVAGGEWSFDSSYFTRDGNTFTALKAGTSKVTYTLNGRSTSIAITVSGSHNVSVSPSDASYGTVSGGGAYPDGATATLTATPASGCHFVNWTENGAEVSTNPNYSFKVTGDRTLVAVFTKDQAVVNPTAYFANKLPAKANAGAVWLIKPVKAPKGYTFKSVSFASGNNSVASVDASGIVNFLKGGKAKLTVKMVFQKGNKTKTVKAVKNVTVNQKIASITLNNTNADLKLKKTMKLVPKFDPASATNKTVKWKSSNSKVATVSAKGVVKGKTRGTAVITCTAKDGSNVSVTCTVTVY